MNESKYFFRKIAYIQNGQEVSLVTGFEPIETSPMEPWMSLVFLMADGVHTVEQMHQNLTLRYQGNIPSDYQKTVNSVLNRLLESEAIGLCDEAMNLPPYLKTSFDKQDQKKSMKMMLKDGYLKMDSLK